MNVSSRFCDAGPDAHPASRVNEHARDQILPLVYDELRRLARAFLARERSDHTLQATVLVHEAYLRLVA